MQKKKRRLQLLIKRVIDFVAALVLLLVLSPLYAALALLVKLDSPGSVFFSNELAGLEGQPFFSHKFRTMIPDAISTGLKYETARDDPRITRLGRFLRRFGLDELPQIYNVLRGEMSLIGPRPTFTWVAEQYDEDERLRLGMRPGITGWAQVHGRNAIPWEERLVYDAEYVANYSLWMDVKIIVMTIPVVLSSKYVYGKDGNVRTHKSPPPQDTNDGKA
ncbi:sugar transferase [Candidatus Hydrogenedentota bacterium]